MIGISPISAMTPQPPYIRFERRPVERRLSAEAGGGSYYVDIDFALVTPHGSKDTTEKAVADWFKRLKKEIEDGRFPQEWLNAYKAAYDAWKNDQEPPLNGTDIRTWPAISPAECKMLTSLRVRTVEELAQANEELLSRIGMGSRALKQKAENWLIAQSDHVPIVARISALEMAQDGLKHQVEAWKARAEAAEAQLKTLLMARGEAFEPPTPIQRIEAATAPDNTDALVADGVREGFEDTEAAEE